MIVHHKNTTGIDVDKLEVSTYHPFSQKQIADLIGVPKVLISSRVCGNKYVGNWSSQGLREEISKYDYWELLKADNDFRKSEYKRHPPLESLIAYIAETHGIII